MTEILETALAHYIEHFEASGTRLDPSTLLENSDDLDKLRTLIQQFHQIDGVLQPEGLVQGREDPEPPDLPAPLVDATLIGEGVGGRVYKAYDPVLDRWVAVKFFRQTHGADWEKMRREARFLATLQDETIVDVYAFDEDRMCLVMPFVDGFDLLDVGSGLTTDQTMAILLRLTQALKKAHARGICHLDIKPANIKLDRKLQPKLLDFGLAQVTGERNHGWGTPGYAAPEQYRARAVLDARSDLFSLGAVFYHLLCGEPPLKPGQKLGNAPAPAITLPKMHRPDLPPGIQAMLMKCLEFDPEDRYLHADALLADLQRFLAGEPVLAKPKNLMANLADRVGGMQSELKQWQQTGLIYGHEAKHLTTELEQLIRPEEDWIVASRHIKIEQVLLYLGVAVLIFGGLALFYARHFLFDPPGGAYPALVLLASCGFLIWMRRRSPKAASIAYDLACFGLLPLALLSFFQWIGILTVAGMDPLWLFPSGQFTNAQLQTALLLATLWAVHRSFRSATVGVASAAVILAALWFLAMCLPWGLRIWVEEGAYHKLAFALLPLCLVMVLLGVRFERRGWAYWAAPAYAMGLVLAVIVPELLALNGKTMSLLGLSAAAPPGASSDYDPILLDTLWAMALNGLALYFLARVLSRVGLPLLGRQAGRLGQITPFLMLEPLALLVSSGYYAPAYHWLFLVAALGILGLSTITQRKGFYFAGLLNTVIALYFISDYYEWFEAPFWPRTLILAGLLSLIAGHHILRRQRSEH